MNTKYDALALFSGGLDSILAVKTLEEQGLKVKCLHFTSPFFGKPELLAHWRQIYGVDLDSVDVGEAFAHMLRVRPEHGFGKLLNPCVDCKILMMRQTRQLMAHYGARCIVSGEVLGQRPMSQRRDTLNVIRRESGLKAELLRPLSALLMDPTSVELSGLVNRSRLHALSGRGRRGQLELAARYGIKEIPTPAGGCRLTEKENACRYFTVLQRLPRPGVGDFELAHTGRQLWSEEGQGKLWLSVGRNADNNARLESLVQPEDLLFRMRDFSGPLGLGRRIVRWTAQAVHDAAALVASFAPHALRQGGDVVVTVRDREALYEVLVTPSRESGTRWREPRWEEAREVIRQEAREREVAQKCSPIWGQEASLYGRSFEQNARNGFTSPVE